MGNRSIIYIDGFNLYYGAVKDARGKRWLNLQQFFERLRQQDDIQRIKYFTTLINGPKRVNQIVYLSALSTLPDVEIIYGQFKPKTIKCMVPMCQYPGNRKFQTQEEKRTDVNIAVHMVADAMQDRCDRLVVVSGDSDLVPAVKMIKAMFSAKTICVYVPARNLRLGAATELRGAADKDYTLPNDLIDRCQFPLRVPTSYCKWVSRPLGW